MLVRFSLSLALEVRQLERRNPAVQPQKEYHMEMREATRE